MIQTDDKVYPTSQSELVFTRRDSDAGYCSNVNSPNKEDIIFADTIDFQKDFIDQTKVIKMNESDDGFTSFSKSIEFQGFRPSSSSSSTMTESLQKPGTVCNSRSRLSLNDELDYSFQSHRAAKLESSKAENFGFGILTCGVDDKKPLTYENAVKKDELQLPISTSFDAQANSFNSQNFKSSNCEYLSVETYPNHESLRLDKPTRLDVTKRLHSDSEIFNSFQHDPNCNNSVIKCETSILSLPQSESKQSLADLGVMDPALLTLTPKHNNGRSSEKLELPLEDVIEKFLQSSQDNFVFTSDEVTEKCLDISDCGEDKKCFILNSSKEPESMGNPNNIGGGHIGIQDPRYSTEDEAWRTYLENPLTAATTAMMSIHGDEDSATALGILYDYYKVPREKRILTYQPEISIADQQIGEELSNTNATLLNKSCNGQTFLTHSTPSIGARGRPISIISSESNHQNTLTPVHIINKIPMPHNEITTLNVVKPEIGMNYETTSDFLHIERAYNDDSKRCQLTPDSAFSESKDSPPHLSQTLTQGDYNFKNIVISQRGVLGKQGTSVATIKSSNDVDGNRTLLSSLSTNSQDDNQAHPGNSIELSSSLNPLHVSGDIFEYTMEAPKSLKQKEGEPIMSYINKGQFYCISLRERGGIAASMKTSRLTSVVQIVFGDSKSEEEQLRHWRYWHARQHTTKQRIIDIADYKESCMLSDVDEFAHNAIRFGWDAHDVAKIFISCNCLSTDFSAQKGIKGLPLLLQIDTYIDGRRNGHPDHRGVCQLKVFCDKGAERKIRDEERKAMRKRQKNGNKGSSVQRNSLSSMDVKPVVNHSRASSPTNGSSTLSNSSSAKRQDIVQFKTMTDRSTPAVYFIPEVFAHCAAMRNHVSPCSKSVNETNFVGGVHSNGSDLDQVFLSGQMESFDSLRSPNKRSLSIVSSEDGEYPQQKLQRVWDSDSNKKVLLYMRKEDNNVYDGVMLKEPTLSGLKDAIQEKYNIPSEKISSVLKKSKKGILVNVDDNIVRHYSNEDYFVIDITSENVNNNLIYKIILSVV